MKRTKENCGRVHIIGVLGQGLRGVAELLLREGIKVSGSDRGSFSEAESLIALGLEFYSGHRAENAEGAELLIYTLAISADNPEYVFARKNGIPTVSRAEFAGYLASRSQRCICAAGSHGKSTLTAMLAHIFTGAQASPTVLSGAMLSDGEYSSRGDGESFILEACEYKDSFLKLRPSIAIINNIELDHTDYFNSLDDLKASFVKYASSATDFVLLNCDDEGARSVRDKICVRVLTYGARDDADFKITNISIGEGEYRFSLAKGGEDLGTFLLKIPGIFNINNAAAAIATAYECGIDIELIRRGVSSFLGIPRRLEYIGEYKNRPVYYDYAHHPTEIYGGINAVHTLGFDPVCTVFKSHTYSRTKDLWDGFVRSLSTSDYVVIGDIYGAREENKGDISAERLAAAIGERAVYSPDESITEALDNLTRGAIILMGAADMTQILKCMKLEKKRNNNEK